MMVGASNLLLSRKSADPSSLFAAGEDGFWLDFSDTDTLWQDTSASTPVTANGQSIARVDDKSGNGFNAQQGTASRMPTYNDSSGVRWAGLDGGDWLEFLSSTALFNWLHNDTGAAIAALCRFGDSTNPDAGYGIIGNNAGTGNKTGIFALYDDRSVVSRNNGLLYTATKSAGGSVNVYSVNQQDVITPNSDESVVISAASDGPLNVYVNDALIASNARESTPSTANASHNLQIGTLGNNVLPLSGRIYQVIARDKEFSDADISLISSYFASKT